MISLLMITVFWLIFEQRLLTVDIHHDNISTNILSIDIYDRSMWAGSTKTFSTF